MYYILYYQGEETTVTVKNSNNPIPLIVNTPLLCSQLCGNSLLNDGGPGGCLILRGRD